MKKIHLNNEENITLSNYINNIIEKEKENPDTIGIYIQFYHNENDNNHLNINIVSKSNDIIEIESLKEIRNLTIHKVRIPSQNYSYFMTNSKEILYAIDIQNGEIILDTNEYLQGIQSLSQRFDSNIYENIMHVEPPLKLKKYNKK